MPSGRRPKKAYLGALAPLLPFQRSDFCGVFKAMNGYPVTMRLLDPPLHEFLPKREELMLRVAGPAQRRREGA